MDRGQQPLVEVQALRALAALAVLLHHAAGRAGHAFTVGAAGVDVFFVISGFNLWTVAARRPATPRRFAWNRLVRVVPLYWLMTLGMVALATLVPAAMPNLGPTPARVLLSLLFVPHRDPAGQIYPLFVPGWTLNYEMFFYLVFAASLGLPRGLRLPAISAALVALVLAGIALAPEGAAAVVCTSPLLLEFLAGVWLAQRRVQGRLPGRAAGAAMAALGLGLYAALEVTGTHSETWRVLFWGAPALLIVAGTLALAAGRPLRLGLARRLGDASYSIYLLHPLLVAAAWRILGGLPLAAYLAACLALSALAGMLCFALVERPLTEALRTRLEWRGRPAAPARA